jgi:hypothetical protein
VVLVMCVFPSLGFSFVVSSREPLWLLDLKETSRSKVLFVCHAMFATLLCHADFN